MDCAKDVKTFLSANKMKQNDDKTEVLIISNSCQRNIYMQYNHINIINLYNAHVNSTEKAHNLEMNLNSQINSIGKSGFYHIRDLSAICNILNEDGAKVAPHAFVTPALDY